MINRVPFFLPWLYPSLTWRMPASEKKLYLTFDDGPVPGPTDFVLETLRRYQIHGTFFCIGDNVRKHPALFRQIQTEGHAIGNHTFNHLSGWKTSLEKYVMNTIQCDDAMKQQGHEPVALFRPPYGRITRAQIQALHAYKIIMWDVLTMDYQRSLSPETCLRNSIRSLRNGSIIVFHDSVKAEHRMAYALPRLIEYGIENGYTFHPIV